MKQTITIAKQIWAIAWEYRGIVIAFAILNI